MKAPTTGAGMRARKSGRLWRRLNWLLRELFDLLEEPPLLEVFLRVDVITRSSQIVIVFVIGNQTHDKVVSPVTSPSITVQSVIRETCTFRSYVLC